MIINNIPYKNMERDTNLSIINCTSSVLDYYNYNHNIDDLKTQYENAYISKEFNDYIENNFNLSLQYPTLSLACMQFILKKYYTNINSEIISTNISSLQLSYLKRKIPLITVGNFPKIVSSIKNTIILKGYVNDFFIINDPYGNVNSKYLDKYGENVLITYDNLSKYLPHSSDMKIDVLRILPI